MRTNEERAALVRKRTEEIKAERQKKRNKMHMTVLGGVSLAACLCILVTTGGVMPQIASELGEAGEASLSHTSGAASLLAGSEALGYVMMGIFAFFLGVCVTLLLYVVHRRQQRQMQESGLTEPGLKRHESKGSDMNKTELKGSDLKESDGNE